MKVGKTTAVQQSPLGVMIYATNMPPEQITRLPGEIDEAFNQRVETARAAYETKRREQELQFGNVDSVEIDDVAKLDLRVVTITEAKVHPNGDKLVVLQVNDGTGESRQIVAGIRQQYPVEKLVGLQIVIVANLVPKKLRGELSQGMLLAAKDNENRLAVLTPHQFVSPGSKVS